MNIAQGILPFQLIEDSSKVLMTSFSGLPLVMETFRALGLPQSIEKYLPLHAHSRRVYLKIAQGHPSFALYQQARKKLLLFSSA